MKNILKVMNKIENSIVGDIIGVICLFAIGYFTLFFGHVFGG
jgi:hypothetical protein